MPADPLTVVLVYPELLGLYGDRGNALVLQHRAAARDLATEVIEVRAGEIIPSAADIYLVGGAEDATMMLAGELLAQQPGLIRGLDAGAVCLAVCAGFQLLSQQYAGPDGISREGIGLLDVVCGRIDGPRAVGEIVIRAEGDDPWISGFENHQGDARLGPGARPLGQVSVGVGNGAGGVEGARQGNVIATYLHGPVLVRNPALADELLTRATGAPLAPYDDERVARLRKERLAAAQVRAQADAAPTGRLAGLRRRLSR